MNRLAILPARGGSKRLPHKNLRMLGDKPLVNHTVEVARDCFEHVIVSSDSDKILNLIETAPNVETQLRPAALATDHSKVIDTVILHFEQNDTGIFDQIWLCLPTCPLRTQDDVKLGQRHLFESIDGVVSITEYEFPPSLGLMIENGYLKGLDPTHPLASGNSRSQDQSRAFRPNGAFYGMWWESFRQYRNFYCGSIKGIIMPRERSIDIDTEFDLNLANLFLKGQK